MLAGVAGLTLSVALAVPPTPPAGVKPVSVIVPGSEGVMLMMVALVTVPSASVALTPEEVAVPAVVVREAGHVGTTGWLVTAACGVTETSSMARAWSLPASLRSRQRSQICWPGAAETDRLADLAVLFAAAFPSSKTPAPVLTNVGLVKLRLLELVHPVVGVSASVMMPALATWYSKAIVCATGTAAPPSRHCSPM